MTEELPVVAAILHDLAGMLSNVSAFAGILEKSPDHPSRGEFLPILSREARSAAEAVTDLQLARSLTEEWARAELAHVEIGRLFRRTAEDLGAPGWLEGLALGASPVVTVWADEGVLLGLLSRALRVAASGNLTGDPPVEAAHEGDGLRLTFDLTHADYEGSVKDDVGRGRRELRPFALLAGAAAAWGGSGELEPDEPLRLTLHFKS